MALTFETTNQFSGAKVTAYAKVASLAFDLQAGTAVYTLAVWQSAAAAAAGRKPLTVETIAIPAAPEPGRPALAELIAENRQTYDALAAVLYGDAADRFPDAAVVD